jgi:hypothetical protein
MSMVPSGVTSDSGAFHDVALKGTTSTDQGVSMGWKN